MKTLSSCLFLLILSYCTVFANNGLFDVDVMEARNIVTAREMVTEHNWLIPTMNGEIRIAKPPLPTWLTALPLLAGKSDDNLRAMRTPAGIAAIVLMIFVYLLVTEVTKDRTIAFICAAVLISSEFLISMSKQASWDIFCHTFMLGAIWLCVSGWQKKGTSFHLFCFAGLLMGLSFMSKGPVAFHSMLLPFLLSYVYSFGYKTIVVKWKGTLLAVFICLTIAATWPAYLYLHIPDVLMHVETAEIHSWLAVVNKPFWYYLPFPVHSGLWLCLFIAAMISPFFPNKYDAFSTSKNYKFLLSWIIWTVFLLTIVPKKSTHYLFPVIVPTSILIGMYIKYLIDIFREEKESVAERVVLAVHAGLLFALGLLSSAFYLYGTRQVNQHYSLYDFLGATIFCVLGLLSWFLFRKRKIFALMTVSAIMVGCFCVLMPSVIARSLPHRGFMALTRSRAETSGKNLPFYSSSPMDIKELWAVGRRVEQIDPNQLTSLPKPLAYFSKEHPAKALQQVSVDAYQITSYLDTHGQNGWYLSLLW